MRTKNLRRRFRKWMAESIDPGPDTSVFPEGSWHSRGVHDYNGPKVTPKAATDFWDSIAQPDPSAKWEDKPVWTRAIGAKNPITPEVAAYMRKRKEAGYRFSFKCLKAPKSAMQDLMTLVDQGATPDFFGIGNEPEGQKIDGRKITPVEYRDAMREQGLIETLEQSQQYGCIPCSPGLVTPGNAIGEWGQVIGEMFGQRFGSYWVPKVHNYQIEPKVLSQLGFKKKAMDNFGLPVDGLLFLEEFAAGFIGPNHGVTQEKIEMVTGAENAEWIKAGMMLAGQDNLVVSPFLLWHDGTNEGYTSITHPQAGLQRREAATYALAQMKATQSFGTVEQLEIINSTHKQIDTGAILAQMERREGKA